MENDFNVKYILYITTNKVNRKFYIGVHKTETPYVFDGYLGCGAKINCPSSYNKGETPLHQAILKYGVNAFIRNTLEVFNTLEEALNKEKEIVNEEFIKRTDTYNAVLGGGTPPLLIKTVYQFDIKGNLVKTWDSETDIRKYYNCKVQFSDIINKKRPFAGYFWSFKPEINIEDYRKECNHGFISQYNLNGVLLNIYKTTTLAAQKLDLDRNAITRAVFKKKPYAGYYFIKSDVDIAEVLSTRCKQMVKKHSVYRYLKSGEFDTEFVSTLQAAKNTFTASHWGITGAIINKKIYAGYLWSYIKSDNYFKMDNPNKKPNVKIAQYDKDGNLIKIWDTPKECKKEFPYALQVCQGKIKSTKGYIFKYI